MKHKLLLCRMLVIAMMAMLLQMSRAVQKPPEDTGAIPVVLAPIRQQHLTTRIHTIGVLTPKTEVLSFDIPGRVAALRVRVGHHVRKGDTLAQLDDEDARNSNKQRKLEFEKAKRKFERIKTLYEQALAPGEDFEDVRDTLNQARIAYDQSRLTLYRYAMRAPGDGKIFVEHLDYPTTVGAGTPIYTFKNKYAPWVVKINLTDRQVFAAPTGTAAQVTIMPYAQKPLEGRITLIPEQANAVDHLYEVEITLDSDLPPLKSGMLADVEINRQSGSIYFVVPLVALSNIRGQSGLIHVVKAGHFKAARLPVSIHAITGKEVAIKEDLSAYMHVITHGKERLTDGSLIQPIL